MSEDAPRGALDDATSEPADAGPGAGRGTDPDDGDRGGTGGVGAGGPAQVDAAAGGRAQRDAAPPVSAARTPPTGYRGPTAGPEAGGGPRPPSSARVREDATPAATAAPVYGRVTRFGGPTGAPAGTTPGNGGSRHPAGTPARPPVAEPVPRWPAPASGPPVHPMPVSGPVPAPSVPRVGLPALLPPAPTEVYASWARRVVASAVDSAPGLVAAVPVVLSYVPLYSGLLRGDLTARPTWWLLVLGLILSTASAAWTVYNRWVLAGRTGQSLGKRATRTWLVSQVDARPVGLLNALVRDLLHVLDRLGYVGYLWPLWDEQRQTLADKVAQTVVVRTPTAPLDDVERAHR